ncbi:SCO7613 C-terminal domain-containing membrane protein [Streptacidiphilus sp. MAP12-20]|uniref:SCO7613 C-terminal domain-containing membrane protein n=1 Tax=Streptacidiphilus sp. MAP12-20 TaxID=3156299 RepID=UPI0035165584
MTSISPICPDCGAPLGPGWQARCPQCGLPLVGPDAAALWQVTMALQAIDHQRLMLVAHREGLLAQLRSRRDAPEAPVPGTSVPGGPGLLPAPGVGAVREVSGRSAQTVLLVLGGLLVSLAALVFTVVSWGTLGLAARTAILLALTACALSLPVVLRRRRLAATAEVSAAVGLGLVLLDCYGARAAGLGGFDRMNPSGYWAVATALVSVGALVYGWGLRMKSPLVAGFLLIRLPALLLVAASGSGRVEAYAAAFVSATVVDCALLSGVHRISAAPQGDAARERLGGVALYQVAATFAVIWAVIGGSVAGAGSMTATHLTLVAWAAAPLGTLAVLALAVSLRYPGLPDSGRQVAAGGAAAALLLAAAGVFRVLLAAPAWTPLAYGAPAAALVLAAAVALRRGSGQHPVLLGAGCAAGLVLVFTSVADVPELVRAILAPLGRVRATWAGTPVPGWSWHIAPAALTGLGLLAAVLTIFAVLGMPKVPRAVLEACAASAVVPALALLPVGVGLPYGLAVAVALLMAALATAAVVLSPARLSRPSRPAVLTVLAVATGLALLWASADRAASIAALAVCAVFGAGLTWRTPATAPLTAACTVLAVGVEAAAVGATAGLSVPATALAVLGVAVASAPAAARIARSARLARTTAVDLAHVSSVVEGTGYGLAAVALLLTLPYPGRLALALTVTGVAALGVALRADRRKAATIAASCLFIGASWIRLALWDVHTPEAYTIAVAALALTIGHLRHRRDPAASSSATYGPGLTVALLPSLLTLWTDGHWLRPLLLGLAALLAVVLGVRFRLRAPLLIGGAVLLLTGVHELAPTVLQVLGLLPRWVPLAAAGLLLLLLGARYEQRLRDARRLRDGLRRLQ